MSLKKVEKFANQISWLPDDIKVILRKNVTRFKPKKETAKYDKLLYDKLYDVICGAIHYDLWLRKQKRKKKNLNKWKYLGDGVCENLETGEKWEMRKDNPGVLFLQGSEEMLKL